MEVIRTPETERTARQTTEAAVAEEPELAAHPGPAEYVKIAVVLAAATAIEVGLYYITSLPHGLYVVLLLFFMAIKFTLVVLWFMHLRFDNRLFRRLFVTGLVLAVSVYMVVLWTFGALKGPFILALGAALLLFVAFLAVTRRRAATPVRRPAGAGIAAGSPGRHGG